jgi:hypothetical protein
MITQESSLLKELIKATKNNLWNISSQTVQNSFNITTDFLRHPSKFFLRISRSTGHSILKRKGANWCQSVDFVSKMSNYDMVMGKIDLSMFSNQGMTDNKATDKKKRIKHRVLG